MIESIGKENAKADKAKENGKAEAKERPHRRAFKNRK